MKKITSEAKIKNIEMNYSNSLINVDLEKLNLEKGLNEITVTNLPFHMENIHDLEFDEVDGVKFTSSYIIKAYKNQEKVEALNLKLKELGKEIRALESSSYEDEERLNFYKRAFNRENNAIDFEELKKLADKYLELTKDITSRLNNLKEDIKEKHNQYKEVEKELLEEKNQTVTNVVLEFLANKDKEINYSFSFITEELHFQAQHVLKTDGVTAKSTLETVANVYNNTGEDIKDVNVTFNTSYGNKYISSPEYMPFDINSFINNLFGYRPRPRPLAKSMAYMAEDCVAAAAPSNHQTNLTDVSFPLKEKITISKSKYNNTIVLQTSTIKGKYKYVTHPSQSNKVYLIYDVDISDCTLIPYVETLVKLNNRYVSKYNLSRLKNKVTFTIDDIDFLQVNRVNSINKISNMDKEGQNKVEVNYKITIDNISDKDVKINVIEPLPTSNNDQIKVNITKPENKLISKDEDTKTNMLETTITVKAKSNETIEISYEIEGNFKNYL